jgi:ABC-type transport system involved in Fe-S cluster assembly fused permease/ATPase subunit
MAFHLERRTGQLSRILERGTRSTQMLFRAVVFTLLPTSLELLLVCTTLGKLFNAAVVAAVGVTFVAYVSWTIRYIELSAAIRKSVNELDARTTGKAVDALLNYETVRQDRLCHLKLEVRQIMWFVLRGMYRGSYKGALYEYGVILCLVQ